MTSIPAPKFPPITSPTPPAFRPVTLTIVIESPEELASLWHRFNDHVGPQGKCRMDELWRTVNAAALEQNVSLV